MYWIDQIQFGTPTQEQYVQMNKETYLDSLFAQLSQYTPPKNSSEQTKAELNELVTYTNTLNTHPDYKKRYKVYDAALISYFHEGLTEDEKVVAQIKDIVNSVIQDSSPLLLKLKYRFNRPRPRQLSGAYQLKMFPHTSKSDNTPSFPSGHVFQARLLCHVLGNKYPKSYAHMMKLLDDISYSRLYLGVHYQSDIDTALFFADEVIKNNEFKLKYVL